MLEIICNCYGVAEDDIVEAIESGLTTISEISEETGASSGCGRCEERFYEVTKRLLKEHKNS